MLALRKLSPLIVTQRLQARYFGKKSPIKMNLNNMQVHQETLRHIDPYARINIRSAILLTVCSADVHEYPNSDVFIAELHGGHVRNCPVEMKVHVSENENQVNVDVSKIHDINADFHCELFVPISAELNIEAEKKVNVAKMYSRAVNIKAGGDITAKDIRAEAISMSSQNGDIKCTGLLLGDNIVIEANNLGNIWLDKLQGNNFSCKTTEGNITVNSCYAEASKFESDTGCLNLKNVHKKTEVYVHKAGQLNMTGVHGNIYVRSNGGKLNLQLSELVDQNIIMADNIEECVINISDAIEKNAYIEINSSSITLDDSLLHLSNCISADNKCFQMSNERSSSNKLMVSTKGAVKLGKLSWVDSMQAMLGVDKN